VPWSSAFDQVEATVPAALDVPLVPDNAATPKTRLDWPLKRPRWHLHFPPRSASWSNLVECGVSLLTRWGRRRGAFVSTDGLQAAIHASIAPTNAQPKPFV
jgi:hypothetical protein